MTFSVEKYAREEVGCDRLRCHPSFKARSRVTIIAMSRLKNQVKLTRNSEPITKDSPMARQKRQFLILALSSLLWHFVILRYFHRRSCGFAIKKLRLNGFNLTNHTSCIYT